jgi:hypothetical protein
MAESVAESEQSEESGHCQRRRRRRRRPKAQKTRTRVSTPPLPSDHEFPRVPTAHTNDPSTFPIHSSNPRRSVWIRATQALPCVTAGHLVYLLQGI